LCVAAYVGEEDAYAVIHTKAIFLGRWREAGSDVTLLQPVMVVGEVRSTGLAHRICSCCVAESIFACSRNGRTKIQVIHGWLEVVGIPHLNHAKENPIDLLIGKIGPSSQFP
jgi:hypothetical protein